jgi:hypothetical protein
MKWLLCLCLLFMAGCCSCPSRYPVAYVGDPWRPIYAQPQYQTRYQYQYPYQPRRHYKRIIIRRIYHVENDWNRGPQYRNGFSY